MVGRRKKEPTSPDELGLGTDVQRLRVGVDTKFRARGKRIVREREKASDYRSHCLYTR